MNQMDGLIDRYIAAWNESDPAARRQLIAAAWTADAQYVDPALQASGHDGIDAMIQSVHARFPGHRFRRVGDVDVHHDRVRFAWELNPENGPAVVKGTDFGVVSGGEKLASVTGFFDQVPAA